MCCCVCCCVCVLCHTLSLLSELRQQSQSCTPVFLQPTSASMHWPDTCLAHKGVNVVSVLHVEDAARAYVLALERGEVRCLSVMSSLLPIASCTGARLLRQESKPLCLGWVTPQAPAACMHTGSLKQQHNCKTAAQLCCAVQAGNAYHACGQDVTGKGIAEGIQKGLGLSKLSSITLEQNKEVWSTCSATASACHTSIAAAS